MSNNSKNQIELFRTLFKGREDVFSVRWEKENKSGYTPACVYDPYFQKMHRNVEKNYRPLTDLRNIQTSEWASINRGLSIAH